MRKGKLLLKTVFTLLISLGINKVNAQNFEWAKSFGGSSTDVGNSVAVDASGNVYTTGYFQGTVDFDPGAGTTNLTSAGDSDIFIQKLDASGNFLWATSFGSSSFADAGLSLVVDASGNIYTTGYFRGTIDFDPGTGITNLTSIGGTDIFIQKLDTSGDFLWAKSFGGNNLERGYSIDIDDSGNIYTMGSFGETVDFDPGVGITNLTSIGGADIFIQKLDASGNFLWAKSFGGVSNDEGLSFTVDASGNVYTTGSFSLTVDFDPDAGATNLTSLGSRDIFVQKLDAFGNFLWAKSFGTSSLDRGYSVAVDASGNVYTTGYFSGTGDFDPGAGTANLTTTGGSDIFVQKLDTSGNFIWATSFGSNAADYGLSIAVDALGNVYTTGQFSGTGDFDPGAGTVNLTSLGSTDIFVHKMNQCSPIDITTTLTGETIAATNSTATYQWLDCDNNNMEIAGETGQTFIATINGNYAVELTENGCVDTSDCVAITTIIGVLESSFNQNIMVFPNPTTGLFTVDLGDMHESVQLTIRDAVGRLVQTYNIGATSTVQISLNQPSGIYFIEIVSDDKTAILKLIKE